jgi:hypothetical protein
MVGEWARTERSPTISHRLKAILGPLAKEVLAARFSHTFGTLMRPTTT